VVVLLQDPSGLVPDWLLLPGATDDERNIDRYLW